MRLMCHVLPLIYVYIYCTKHYRIYFSLVRNNLYFLVSKVRSRNSKVRSRNSGKKKKNFLICISKICMIGRRQTWAKVFFLHMISIKKDLSAYRIATKRLCKINRQTVAEHEFMLHTYKKFGFFTVVEFLLFINDRSKGLGSVVKKAPQRLSCLRSHSAKSTLYRKPFEVKSYLNIKFSCFSYIEIC